MSMLLSMKRLTENSREKLLADPNSIELCFDFSTHQVERPAHFFQRLSGCFRKKKNAKQIERDPCFGEQECDIEKSWDILCFLLCGESYASGAFEKSFPDNFLFCNGSLVKVHDNDNRFSYGPPWTYSPQEVKQIAEFLNRQDEERLREKFIPSALGEAEVYPSMWDDYDDPESQEWLDTWEWVAENFQSIKKFVNETANRNLALLLYLY